MSAKKNKKSFVLHLDSLAVLDEMNDEQAGRLFRAIANFQKDGDTGAIDQITKIALSSFLAQFSRDDARWEKEAVSGKIGNLKRHHPEIFQQFFNEEITLEEAERMVEIKKLKAPSGAITPDRVASGDDRVGSHSVSVSVSVSEEDNSITQSNLNIRDKSRLVLKDEFEEFWQSYTPVKPTGATAFTDAGSKKMARIAYEKARKKYSADEIFNGTAAYLVECFKNNRSSCHASTALNQERFLIEKKEILEVKKNA